VFTETCQTPPPGLAFGEPDDKAPAGYPVRRGFSILSLMSRNTGSPAFAGDDGSDKFQTAVRDSAISRLDSPEFCKSCFAAPKKRGRGECRVPNAPAASCVIKNKHTSVVTTGSPEITRHSRTQWFTAYFVLSPATNSSCHRHPRIKVSSVPGWATSLRELDTSNGCQNDTSSPSAALRLSQRLRRAKRRSSACHSSAHGPYDPPCHPLTSPDAAASTASRPALVTTRDRPSVGRDGTTQ